METPMTTRTHTLSFGNFELTVFDDGSFNLPAAYFANVPPSVSEGLAETLTIGANLWYIRTGDRRVLVDTGSANALKAMFAETGQAWDDLNQESPTDIVLPHMHADHLGAFAEGAIFPDAKVHVAKAEWEFWTNKGLADAVPEDQRPMVQVIQQVAASFTDRVVLHDGATELAPGLSLEPLPGHTPGHTGIRLTADQHALLIIGDAVISENLQFANPGISYALDGDAEQAIKTRRELLQACAQDSTTIAATHFAFPGIGKVSKDGDAFRFDLA